MRNRDLSRISEKFDKSLDFIVKSVAILRTWAETVSCPRRNKRLNRLVLGLTLRLRSGAKQRVRSRTWSMIDLTEWLSFIQLACLSLFVNGSRRSCLSQIMTDDTRFQRQDQPRGFGWCLLFRWIDAAKVTSIFLPFPFHHRILSLSSSSSPGSFISFVRLIDRLIIGMAEETSDIWSIGDLTIEVRRFESIAMHRDERLAPSPSPTPSRQKGERMESMKCSSPTSHSRTTTMKKSNHRWLDSCRRLR